MSDRPALRAALSHMQIEEPGTDRRFETVLAERNGWTPDFAERVADEYCGFLYLSWPHYRDVLCGQMIGRPIEHRPGTGEPEDEARCLRQYEETLALYEQVFGKLPPPDIWPSPSAQDEDGSEALDPGQERKRHFSGRAAFGSLVGSVTMFAFGAPVLGILLAGTALVFFIASQPPAAAARDRSSGSCGGAGCGGGSGGRSDDGVVASCGGGGCGGGCGGD